MSKAGVDFLGDKKRVAKADADRQQHTLRAVMHKLSRQPGVILADEVGMGKTYVALGVVAEYLVRYPKSRVLILTPSRELAEKWTQDLMRFREENVSARARELLKSPPDLYQRRLSEVLGDKNQSRVWVLPISTLLSDGTHDPEVVREQRILVYQMLTKAAGLNGYGFRDSQTRQHLWRMLNGSIRKMPHRRKHLTWLGFPVSGHLHTVQKLLGEEDLRRLRDGDFTEAHLKEWRDLIRWRLLGERLRRFHLIVVDEAHHLRNPYAKRYRIIESVFDKKFRDMLFLTATPFQLGPEELEHVLALFRLSVEPGGRTVEDEARQLTEQTADYQRHVRQFEAAWHALDDRAKATIASPTNSKKRLRPTAARLHGDPQVDDFFDKLNDLRRSHEQVTAALSKWVIRNVKDRSYRDSNDEAIRIDDDDKLPFALLHRLIYEYERRQRTFSAVQNLSLTSSWSALAESAVMTRRIHGAPPVKFYRGLLRNLATKRRSERHPKVAALVDQVLDSYRRNEKTLVFTSRMETVKTLQRLLNERLEADAFAACGTTRGSMSRHELERRLSSFRDRVTRVRDPLWLTFQENLFRTFLAEYPDREELYREAIRFLDTFLGTYRVGLKGKARGPDWHALQTLCEWLVFHRGLGVPKDPKNPASTYWKPFAGTFYMDFRKNRARRFSLELERGVLRHHCCGESQLRAWLNEVLDVHTVWDSHVGDLGDMPYALRADLLDTARSALLVPEVVGPAVAATAAGTRRGQTERAVINAFRKSQVAEKITRFLSHVRDLPEAEVRQFIEGLETANMVARASGEESTADRLRYRYGFNTPFRPYVLVASDVMQEGLDLHRECSRVIHYDLAWNPAVLEQRVGRIDRLGSKTDRRLRTDGAARLQIDRRYLPGTIDERMFLRVRDRERWFKFILGNRPEWDEDAEDPASASRLPEVFSDEFQIRLEG